jgi:hypothetical protein
MKNMGLHGKLKILLNNLKEDVGAGKMIILKWILGALSVKQRCPIATFWEKQV